MKHVDFALGHLNKNNDLKIYCVRFGVIYIVDTTHKNYFLINLYCYCVIEIYHVNNRLVRCGF